MSEAAAEPVNPHYLNHVVATAQTHDLLAAEDIVKLREKAGVSQAVFARALNVTTDYVSKIERGAKRPSGSTLKLLSLMRRKGFEAIL